MALAAQSIELLERLDEEEGFDTNWLSPRQRRQLSGLATRHRACEATQAGDGTWIWYLTAEGREILDAHGVPR